MRNIKTQKIILAGIVLLGGLFISAGVIYPSWSNSALTAQTQWSEATGEGISVPACDASAIGNTCVNGYPVIQITMDNCTDHPGNIEWQIYVSGVQMDISQGYVNGSASCGTAVEWSAAVPRVVNGSGNPNPQPPQSNHQYAWDTAAPNQHNVPYSSNIVGTTNCAQPLSPSPLSASCPAPGTTATVSLTPVAGATNYGFWVDDTSNGWNGSPASCTDDGNASDCVCSNLPGDFCVSTGLSTSHTFPSVAGRTYNFFGFAERAGIWSDPAGPSSFSCATANQAPNAVATISKDNITYANSISVTQGVPTPVYLSADGSNDPDGWTDPVKGVSSGGKCDWNSDLNQGAPSFETTVSNPASPAACNISLGTLTFNDPPGFYTYQVLRITDRLGAVSPVDSVTVNVLPPLIPPLTATCDVSPPSVNVGQNVTWSASASGGDGSYTYLWSGNPPLQGRTGNPVVLSYPTPGVKSGSVAVTSAGQIFTAACDNSVNVAAVINPPSLTIQANGRSGRVILSAPANYIISWTSDDTDSCVASGAWSGARPTAGSESYSNVDPGVYVYNLLCTGPGGSVSDSVEVDVIKIIEVAP